MPLSAIDKQAGWTYQTRYQYTQRHAAHVCRLYNELNSLRREAESLRVTINALKNYQIADKTLEAIARIIPSDV